MARTERSAAASAGVADKAGPATANNRGKLRKSSALYWTSVASVIGGLLLWELAGRFIVK